MATTLKQTEAATELDAIWQRIESYIAHRFVSRPVVWIVEGPGEWTPPLTPATIETVEAWNGAAWETCTAPDSPLGGYWLTARGPYRFTGTVGGGQVPAPVAEAYARLDSYLSAIDQNTPGARSYSIAVPDVETVTIERDATWIARAMQQSGAADLLRPYRRA